AFGAEAEEVGQRQSHKTEESCFQGGTAGHTLTVASACALLNPQHGLLLPGRAMEGSYGGNNGSLPCGERRRQEVHQRSDPGFLKKPESRAPCPTHVHQ